MSAQLTHISGTKCKFHNVTMHKISLPFQFAAGVTAGTSINVPEAYWRHQKCTDPFVVPTDKGEVTTGKFVAVIGVSKLYRPNEVPVSYRLEGVDYD